MISSDEYVIRCDELAWRKYDDEVVIISEDGSQIHSLNKVASFIWELSDNVVTVNDIVARICDRFDVKKDIAQADTMKFIQQLVDKNLIQLGKHSCLND